MCRQLHFVTNNVFCRWCLEPRALGLFGWTKNPFFATTIIAHELETMVWSLVQSRQHINGNCGRPVGFCVWWSKSFMFSNESLCFIFRCAASLSQAMRQVGAWRHKHTLPDLTYDYGALEPHISAEIMQLHHSKHHATYVNNLNVAEEKYQEALAKSMDAIWVLVSWSHVWLWCVIVLISGDVTAQVALQPALKFNGGGHVNHTIFWTNLSPNGGGEPQGNGPQLNIGLWRNLQVLTSACRFLQGSWWRPLSGTLAPSRRWRRRCPPLRLRCRGQAGAGWATAKRLEGFVLLPVATRTPSKERQVGSTAFVSLFSLPV